MEFQAFGSFVQDNELIIRDHGWRKRDIDLGIRDHKLGKPDHGELIRDH